MIASDNEKINKKNYLKRDSNLELFRIVVMVLIVAHHYVVNSGLLASDGPVYANPLSGKSIFYLLIGAWGKTGINCFVLISGYFMCTSNISARKFVKIVAEILFYGVVINGVFWISGYASITFKGLLEVIIPVREISTGFVSAYIVFFLFIPFLNILIHNMSEKEHTWLLALCSFTYIFLGTFPFFSVTINYVSWFIVLYFITSYIRLYPKKIFYNTKLWGGMTILAVMISALSVIFCAWLGLKMERHMAYYFVTDSNTFLAVFTSISAFMFFRNLKLKNNRIINTVAASTFGVLLIHANSSTMRNWLWKDIFKNVEMYNSSWCYLHMIMSVLIIFIVCVLIDYLRIRFIERPFLRLWDRYNGRK